MRHAVETGKAQPNTGWSGALFCEIYRLFFADLVTDFLTATIAGHLTATVPILTVVDPTETIAE
ncbi:hypothetical protein LY13_003140 [Prauserella aidingensis]|nr:hypothetical protein [Prauserella aidingensis]